jgi:hypothetical protein
MRKTFFIFIEDWSKIEENLDGESEKMKFLCKLFVYITIPTLLILSLLGTYVWKERVPLLSKTLSKTLGLPVSLETLSISSQGFKIGGLKISNPKAMKKANALEVGELEVLMPLSHLLNDPVEVDALILRNSNFYMEILDVAGEKTNWTEVIDRLEPEKKSGKKNKSEEKQEFILKEIQIEKMELELSHPVLGSSKTKIKNISFQGAKGLSSKRMMQFILKAMLGYVVKVPQFEKLLKNAITLPQNILKGIFLPGKKVDLELEPLDIDLENSKVKRGVFETFQKADKFMKSFTPFKGKSNENGDETP